MFNLIFMVKNIIYFGEKVKGIPYRVLNERAVRGSSGIMLFIGIIAFINGFILRNISPIPYLIGFLLINFLIGIFINPKYAPTIILAKMLIQNQTPLYVGAIQKKFAWSLGAILTSIAFVISIKLQFVTYFFPYFPILCLLCILCIFLIYFETAFGICFGCKLYDVFLKFGWIKAPKVHPNCIGDSCSVSKNN